MKFSDIYFKISTYCFYTFAITGIICLLGVIFDNLLNANILHLITAICYLSLLGCVGIGICAAILHQGGE